ncbi:MAG: hypothetical protein IKG21_12010 [Atopobiaceae bacterium]|nr:hypothetical protein [Atopobiaceae bacterium]
MSYSFCHGAEGIQPWQITKASRIGIYPSHVSLAVDTVTTIGTTRTIGTIRTTRTTRATRSSRTNRSNRTTRSARGTARTIAAPTVSGAYCS